MKCISAKGVKTTHKIKLEQQKWTLTKHSLFFTKFLIIGCIIKYDKGYFND